MVGGGDTVEIGETSPLPALAPDIDVKVEILFRDPAMLVVNKPAPMACHPLRPGERGTVMNGVVAAFPEAAGVGDNPREGGLVHRLDNGTSGRSARARSSHRLSRHCARRFERAGFAEITRLWSPAILKNHFILKNRSRTIRATRDECSRSERTRLARVLPQRRSSQYGGSGISPWFRRGRAPGCVIRFACIWRTLAIRLLVTRSTAGRRSTRSPRAASGSILRRSNFARPSPGPVRVRSPLPRDLENALKEASRRA